MANSGKLSGALRCFCIVLVPILAGPLHAKPVLTILPVNAEAYAINDSGVVAGTVSGSAFVRTPDGTITTFQAGGNGFTTARGINNSGVTAGYYYGGQATHGFVRDADGTITTFDAPGAGDQG